MSIFRQRLSGNVRYVGKARETWLTTLQGVHKKSHKDAVNMPQMIRGRLFEGRLA